MLLPSWTRKCELLHWTLQSGGLRPAWPYCEVLQAAMPRLAFPEHQEPQLWPGSSTDGGYTGSKSTNTLRSYCCYSTTDGKTGWVFIWQVILVYLWQSKFLSLCSWRSVHFKVYFYTESGTSFPTLMAACQPFSSSLWPWEVWNRHLDLSWGWGHRWGLLSRDPLLTIMTPSID